MIGERVAYRHRHRHRHRLWAVPGHLTSHHLPGRTLCLWDGVRPWCHVVRGSVGHSVRGAPPCRVVMGLCEMRGLISYPLRGEVTKVRSPRSSQPVVRVCSLRDSGVRGVCMCKSGETVEFELRLLFVRAQTRQSSDHTQSTHRAHGTWGLRP